MAITNYTKRVLIADAERQEAMAADYEAKRVQHQQNADICLAQSPPATARANDLRAAADTLSDS